MGTHVKISRIDGQAKGIKIRTRHILTNTCADKRKKHTFSGGKKHQTNPPKTGEFLTKTQ